jgi:hypothetical protein
MGCDEREGATPSRSHVRAVKSVGVRGPVGRKRWQAAARMAGTSAEPGGEAQAQYHRASFDGDRRSLGGISLTRSAVFAGGMRKKNFSALITAPAATRSGYSAVPDLSTRARNTELGINLDPKGKKSVLMSAYKAYQRRIYQAAYAVLDRTAWGARARKGKSTFSPPRRITVHHTQGVRPSGRLRTAKRVRYIQDYHMVGRAKEGKKVFSDIGYHFLISGDGSVVQGRPTNTLGAHALGANSGNIGIALMGNFNKYEPSAAQLDSLRRLSSFLAVKYGIDAKIDGAYAGHSHHSDTDCPGKNLKKHLRWLADDTGGRFHRARLQLSARKVLIGPA